MGSPTNTGASVDNNESSLDGVDLDPSITRADSASTDFDTSTTDASTTSPASFQCVIVEVATEFEDHTTDYEHACIARGVDGEWDDRYHIDDNGGKIVDKLSSDHGLDMMHHSGRYKVTMSNVMINVDNGVVTTTDNTEVDIDDLGEGALESRRLGQKTGTRTMVVIRVTATNDNTSSSKTANKIADSFFGVNGDETSLSARFDACSMGHLKFAPGTGHDFVDGVAEVSIALSAGGSNIFDFERSVTSALITKYGSSLRNTYDHVVYAVPRGTQFGAGGSDRWLAYAYMNSYLSVYNDDNIAYISNQVHETGHNLGLMHSNHGAVKYGDQSGTMGYGYGREDFPKMCFNAAKSWQLGWYDDKADEVKPEAGAFTGRIVAFVDYESTSDNVLYKVGTKYIIYNKAKGPNSQTMEFANSLTITDMPFEGDYSDAVASLNSNGATYVFDHAGAKAVIEYCNNNNSGGVDGVKISIYMEADGSACNGQSNSNPEPPPAPKTPQPQAAVTPSPVPATPQPVPATPAPRDPTRAPTPIPPTDAPVTRAPTPMPTARNCSSTSMEVVITIHTDSKPNETSWYFKRTRGQTYGSGDGFTEAFKTYTYEYCLKATDTFEFHLLDSNGDGIASDEFGHGYYTIQVNGEVYSSGGYFHSEEIDYVQGKCRNANAKRLQFILTTGFHPEDVTWSLTSDPNVVDHTGGPWPNSAGKSIAYFAHACLDDSVCYTVGVHSAKGNGLDRGNFEVNWDDENVGFSTFVDGLSHAFSFGACGITENGRKLDLTQEIEIFEEYGEGYGL